MGPVLRHQHAAGTERARRRQHLLGGLLNCYFWVDPVRRVTGALFTQILPFFDERVVALYGEFERGLYAGLA